MPFGERISVYRSLFSCIVVQGESVPMPLPPIFGANFKIDAPESNQVGVAISSSGLVLHTLIGQMVWCPEILRSQTTPSVKGSFPLVPAARYSSGDSRSGERRLPGSIRDEVGIVEE